MGSTPQLPALIVGGSMGGLRAAESLRRNGYSGPISILGEEPCLPYNRPPLSKIFLAGESSEEQLFFPFASDLDVNWILGAKAARLSLDQKTVIDSQDRSHQFESLVIATGLRPKTLFELSHAVFGLFTLRSLDDAKLLRNALKSKSKVLVIGSGFIGCEVAATAAQLGCTVTVISATSTPMESALGEVFGMEMRKRLEHFGIKFYFGVRAEKIEVDESGPTNRVTGALLSDGSTIDADLILQAVGSIPNTEWMEGNNLDLSDGVLTNGSMQVVTNAGDSLEHIYAVGDVARFPYPLFENKKLRIEHWNIPVETAKRAGRVLAAKLENLPSLSAVMLETFSPMPSFWTDQFNINIFGMGIPGLADREEVLEGHLGENFVMGYFSGSNLVGVCGLNMRSRVMNYRTQIGLGNY